MAHPHRKQARDGHNAKLRKMTDGYGLGAGPSQNISAPDELPGGPMPEFGAQRAEGDLYGPRGDKMRRGGAAKAKRAHGGRLKHRADGGDVSAIEEANRDQAMTTKRAHGGRTKPKGSTHVNVIVAPQGGGAGGPSPVPSAALLPQPPAGGPPAAPPPMPPRPPMMAGPGGAPMAPGAPGGLPPGLIPPRKRGGRVEKHGDEAQDKALIHKVLRQEGLERRARGGGVRHDMTAGAMSGVGRLEKIGEKPKKPGRAQVV